MISIKGRKVWFNDTYIGIVERVDESLWRWRVRGGADAGTAKLRREALASLTAWFGLSS